MRETFRRCACSGAAGVATGHAGCLLAPVLAVAGAGGAAGSLFLGTSLTALGLAVWYALHGRGAPPRERRMVAASALAGAIVMTAFHMAADHRAVDEPHPPPEMRKNAAALGMSISNYMRSICLPPRI